jgi:hypothetical protein
VLFSFGSLSSGHPVHISHAHIILLVFSMLLPSVLVRVCSTLAGGKNAEWRTIRVRVTQVLSRTRSIIDGCIIYVTITTTVTATVDFSSKCTISCGFLKNHHNQKPLCNST